MTDTQSKTAALKQVRTRIYRHIDEIVDSEGCLIIRVTAQKFVAFLPCTRENLSIGVRYQFNDNNTMDNLMKTLSDMGCIIR